VRAAREKTLRTALEKEDIMNKWSQTSWAKKIAARVARANMNDFERHQLMVARKNRSREVRKVLKKTTKKKDWATMEEDAKKKDAKPKTKVATNNKFAMLMGDNSDSESEEEE